jgi:hypothetical protein
MADAARVAAKHGFVLRTVRHEGRLRIAMVRPQAAEPPAAPAGAERPAKDPSGGRER